MSSAPPSKLFAADSAHFAVGSVANPNPGPGVLTVDRIISGTYTSLSNNIGSLALDTANDRLYVGNGTSILVFNGASTANGDIFPNRAITVTGSPGIGNTVSMFLDRTNDRLYVGDDVVGVRVFDSASTITSVAASTRLISGGLGTSFTIRGVAVDAAKDILYVSNDTPSSHQISVFAGASTVNGSDPVTRTITLSVGSTGGIFLDAANDRLYVAGGPANMEILVFNNASTASGPVTPTRTLTMPSAINSVVVDTANDRLYGVNPNAIYIVNGASAASGTVAETTVLPPPLGQYAGVAVGP